MHKLNLGLLAAAALFVAGCTSAPPEPLEVVDSESVEATVLAVDQERRLVALRGPEGNDMVIHVQPEVRNLAQVREGDVLRVSYTRALLAELTEAGQASGDVPVAAAAAVAPEGGMPGAAIGAEMAATVEVVSVGDDGASITFRGPGGHLRSLDVAREESRAFVRKLDAGDLVDLTYTEAIAIEVEHVD